MAERKLRLGDRVSIQATLKRELKYEAGGIGRRRIKEWCRRPLKQERQGVYIGYRTLSNGWIEWGGEEVGNIFYPTAHFRAHVVVLGERERPVFVHPDDMVRLASCSCHKGDGEGGNG